ncbi:MAG: glycosyltransferase family 4 protein [Chloroflexi bacterium]|nr:glycosyltransferase family 4 protein [Chloroflexota bacterium]
MHILIVHQAFASLEEPGGTRHHEFARLLAARGHRVTIIASPISYLTGTPTRLVPSGHSPHFKMKWGETEGGVRILRASAYAAHHKSFVHRALAFILFMFSSLWLGLKVKQVNLIWGTSPPIFQGVTAWILSRVKHAPLLFEVRDLWPLFAAAAGVLRNPLLIRLSEWLEGFLYRGAERVMVNSPGFVEHVRSRGARQVELIPNGADASMFDPDMKGAEIRRAHGLEGKYVVLYAGAHGMSNDLGVVLEAAGLLRGNPQIQIVLVGDGKEKAALQDRCREMDLKNVSFLPPMPKTEMPQVLAAADACLAILKPLEEYKLTYPNKVFDYMAAGRPVVLAIDGVIRSVVEDAGCGIFVPPGDPAVLAQAMLKLAQDPVGACRMGLKGRKYLEQNFNREKMGDQLIELMEGMIRRG